MFLELKQKLFRNGLLESINDMVFVHGLTPSGEHGPLLFASELACQALGFSQAELLHLKESDILFREPVLNPTGEDSFDTVLVARSGERIHVEATARIDEIDGQSFVFTVVRSVEARNRLEAGLRGFAQEKLEVHELMDLGQQIADVGSWDWNMQTGDVTWSDHMYRLMGYVPRSIEPEYEVARSHVHEEDVERYEALIGAAVEARSAFDFENRVYRGQEQLLWVRSRGDVFCNDQGEPIRMLGTVQNISDRKAAESVLESAMREIQDLKEQLEAENITLRKEVREARDQGDMVGSSDAIQTVFMQVQQVATTGSTVLILGETGTGKELVARAIHDLSDRRDHPLMVVNCAAIPATLIESELFGREKGAYTGAQSRQAGRFELAHRGTIFLDEIGELPGELQAKLLRVLQEGQFERLGSSKTISVDVRIIAATNKDLERLVAEDKFRKDFFYRLNVFPIAIPPLRERATDIPLLVDFFVEEFGRKMGKPIRRVRESSIASLVDYSWPGNIRELKNTVERAMITANSSVLTIQTPIEVVSTQSSPTTLADSERAHILDVLESVRWRIRGENGAAAILDINPSTLESRMKKLKIKRPRY